MKYILIFLLTASLTVTGQTYKYSGHLHVVQCDTLWHEEPQSPPAFLNCEDTFLIVCPGKKARIWIKKYDIPACKLRDSIHTEVHGAADSTPQAQQLRAPFAGATDAVTTVITNTGAVYDTVKCWLVVSDVNGKDNCGWFKQVVVRAFNSPPDDDDIDSICAPIMVKCWQVRQLLPVDEVQYRLYLLGQMGPPLQGWQPTGVYLLEDRQTPLHFKVKFFEVQQDW